MWTVLIVGVLLGGFLGFHLGRWCADGARARHDMAQTWRSRRRYRTRS